MNKASSRITTKVASYILSILTMLSPLTAIADDQATSNQASKDQRNILFLGDSLTAGYGLEEKFSYPSRIQQLVNNQKLKYRVINAGVSGDTSSSALRRIEWLLKNPVDVLVLAVGTNDGLRGLPVETTKMNLFNIISKVKSKNPRVKILLAGMLIPPSMGKSYADSFKKIFPELAAKTKSELIPFLLEGVAGEPKLNLPDGIHPTAEGYKLVTENVWSKLESMLVH